MWKNKADVPEGILVTKMPDPNKFGGEVYVQICFGGGPLDNLIYEMDPDNPWTFRLVKERPNCEVCGKEFDDEEESPRRSIITWKDYDNNHHEDLMCTNCTDFMMEMRSILSWGCREITIDYS